MAAIAPVAFDRFHERQIETTTDQRQPDRALLGNRPSTETGRRACIGNVRTASDSEKPVWPVAARNTAQYRIR